MFYNNDRVSGSQLKKMLVFDMLSVSVIILPWLAASGAGKDGLIAIALGSAAACAYGAFLLFTADKLAGVKHGRVFGVLFAVPYLVKLVFSCWFTLALFTKVVSDTLLPDTNDKIIMLTLILVSIYAASKGLEVRARIAEVFFYIVLLPLAALLALGAKRVQPANLFPLLTQPADKIACAAYAVLITYSALEMLVFSASAFSHEPRRTRYGAVIQAVCITAAINLALFVLVVGLLSEVGAVRQFKSSIMIMQLIQLPGGFVQRQDAVMLTIWLLGIFTLLSAYFHYLRKLSVLPGLRAKPAVLPAFGALLFALGFIDITIDELLLYYGRYMAYIGLPQSLCLPCVALVAGKIKQGGRV